MLINITVKNATKFARMQNHDDDATHSQLRPRAGGPAPAAARASSHKLSKIIIIIISITVLRPHTMLALT